MTTLFRNGFLVAAALTALAAGYGGFQWFSHRQSQEAATVLVDFSLPDLDGKTRWLSEWRGRVIVLNFWATWCAPCREEIPMLIELQKRHEDHGVRIVGVALDHR